VSIPAQKITLAWRHGVFVRMLVCLLYQVPKWPWVNPFKCNRGPQSWRGSTILFHGSIGGPRLLPHKTLPLLECCLWRRLILPCPQSSWRRGEKRGRQRVRAPFSQRDLEATHVTSIYLSLTRTVSYDHSPLPGRLRNVVSSKPRVLYAPLK
jgi:hypothetical protein